MIVARDVHYPSFEGFSSATGMEDQAVASGETRYQRRAQFDCVQNIRKVEQVALTPRHLVTRRGPAQFSESPGYREPNKLSSERHDLADSKSEDSATGA